MGCGPLIRSKISLIQPVYARARELGYIIKFAVLFRCCYIVT